MSPGKYARNAEHGLLEVSGVVLFNGRLTGLRRFEVGSPQSILVSASIAAPANVAALPNIVLARHAEAQVASRAAPITRPPSAPNTTAAATAIPPAALSTAAANPPESSEVDCALATSIDPKLLTTDSRSFVGHNVPSLVLIALRSSTIVSTVFALSHGVSAWTHWKPVLASPVRVWSYPWQPTHVGSPPHVPALTEINPAGQSQQDQVQLLR